MPKRLYTGQAAIERTRTLNTQRPTYRQLALLSFAGGIFASLLVKLVELLG